MTEPVRTRADVVRAVADWLYGKDEAVGELSQAISAALLAMAECDHLCIALGGDATTSIDKCAKCHGTSLDQSRVARCLDALEGR